MGIVNKFTAFKFIAFKFINLLPYFRERKREIDMKTITTDLRSIFIAAVALCVLAFSQLVKAEPVMNLITINTADGAGYAAWAKGSAEVISKSNGAMAMGLCSPAAGAEQQGDHYLWSLFDSQTTAWSNTGLNQTVIDEVAKMKVERTVRDWDNWRILRAAPDTSARGYAWNLIVRAENAGSYLMTLDKLSAALKENGHEVDMQVYMADTGRWAGLFMVSMSAEDGATLGAAMDDRSQPWFSEILTGLEGSREYVHGFALQCETYYSQPQE